jgi:hypothetical protein
VTGEDALELDDRGDEDTIWEVRQEETEVEGADVEPLRTSHPLVAVEALDDHGSDEVVVATLEVAAKHAAVDTSDGEVTQEILSKQVCTRPDEKRIKKWERWRIESIAVGR